MPRPSTADCAEVQLIYTEQGQFCENVLHFQNTLSFDTLQLQQLGTDIIDWWNTSVKPLTSFFVNLVQVIVTDLSTPSGAQIVVTEGLPSVGGSSATAEPMNVTIAIKHLTEQRGRSFRGRTYFVGLGQNQVTGSSLVPGAALALQNAFRALRDYTFTGSALQWVVLSEVHNKTQRASGVTTPIIDVGVEGTTDSQRRRLPGRGR